MSKEKPNYRVVLHYTSDSIKRTKSVITDSYVKMIEQVLQGSNLPQKLQTKAIDDLMEYYKK